MFIIFLWRIYFDNWDDIGRAVNLLGDLFNEIERFYTVALNGLDGVVWYLERLSLLLQPSHEF